MAFLEQAVFNRLYTYSAASAVFSGRVYDMRLPQDVTFPCCSYNRVASTRLQGHDQTVGLARSIVRVNCWGETYRQAKNGANAVRQTWDGFAGTIVSVLVSAVLMDTEIDLFEEDRLKEGEKGVYQTNVEMIIWHHET